MRVGARRPGAPSFFPDVAPLGSAGLGGDAAPGGAVFAPRWVEARIIADEQVLVSHLLTCRLLKGEAALPGPRVDVLEPERFRHVPLAELGAVADHGDDVARRRGATVDLKHRH